MVQNVSDWLNVNTNANEYIQINKFFGQSAVTSYLKVYPLFFDKSTGKNFNYKPNQIDSPTTQREKRGPFLRRLEQGEIPTEIRKKYNSIYSKGSFFYGLYNSVGCIIDVSFAELEAQCLSYNLENSVQILQKLERDSILLSIMQMMWESQLIIDKSPQKESLRNNFLLLLQKVAGLPLDKTINKSQYYTNIIKAVQDNKSKMSQSQIVYNAQLKLENSLNNLLNYKPNIVETKPLSSIPTIVREIL